MTHRLFLTSPLALQRRSPPPDTWTRSGPHMTVERSYDGSGSGTVLREFHNGARVNRTMTCDANPWLGGCNCTANIRTQDGQDYSVDRNSLTGPLRGRAKTSITGPEGSRVVSPRRWRR